MCQEVLGLRYTVVKQDTQGNLLDCGTCHEGKKEGHGTRCPGEGEKLVRGGLPEKVTSELTSG